MCVWQPASAGQVSSEDENSFPRMNCVFILPKSVPYSVLGSGAGYYNLWIRDNFFPSLFCLRV